MTGALLCPLMMKGKMMKADGYMSRGKAKGASKKTAGAHPGFKKPNIGTGKPKSAGVSAEGGIGREMNGNYGSNANVTAGKAKTWC